MGELNCYVRLTAGLYFSMSTFELEEPTIYVVLWIRTIRTIVWGLSERNIEITLAVRRGWRKYNAGRGISLRSHDHYTQHVCF